MNQVINVNKWMNTSTASEPEQQTQEYSAWPGLYHQDGSSIARLLGRRFQNKHQERAQEHLNFNNIKQTHTWVMRWPVLSYEVLEMYTRNLSYRQITISIHNNL